MVATDLSKLRLPAVVRGKIGADRTTSVIEHPIPVNFDWWNDRLKTYGLPGGSIQGRDDNDRTTDSGNGWITRGDVFQIAKADLSDPDNVCQLLWYSLAWGAGPNRRLCDKRMNSVVEDRSRVVDGLSDAAELSKASATVGAAFQVVCPSTKKNLVPFLGPAFATKFLYFAGAGVVDHPSLILDSVVAKVLRDRCGWKSLSPRGGWPQDTYVRYCTLLGRWADEASDEHRTIAADEIERALFRVGRGR